MSQLPASHDSGAVIETPLRRDLPASQSDAGQRPVKPLPAWEKHLPKVYLVVLIVVVAITNIYVKYLNKVKER